MNDDPNERRSVDGHGSRRSSAVTKYDRRVQQALCSADWISRWSAYAASLAIGARSQRLATLRIYLKDPRPRFLSSLSRQGYLIGSEGFWYLSATWPSVDSEYVLDQSSLAAVRVLTSILEDEAEFLACVLLEPE